jgi:hypothetical protein
MPHFTCSTCRIRVQTAGGPNGQPDPLCPECGSPCEPVRDLAEALGFRLIDRPDAFAIAQAVAMPRPDTTL